jgi:hypothetical protein
MKLENSSPSVMGTSQHPSFIGNREATRLYDSPGAILADRSLDDTKRRELLAEWLSDICAVESMPTLRRAPFSTRAVTFEEIMNALVTLDMRHLRRRAPYFIRDDFVMPPRASND